MMLKDCHGNSNPTNCLAMTEALYIMTWKYFTLLTLIFLTACHDRSWNNPYPAADREANIYYSSFSEQPKTLDPAKSYSNDETLFIAQIYEPPLQYHYLK